MHECAPVQFSDFLAALFQALAREGVQACVLRNYQQFPARNIGNDIDLLIAPSALLRAVHALRSIPGVRIAGYSERPAVANVFLEGISRNTDSRALEIDFDLSLTWKGLPYLSVEEVLAAAIAHPAGETTFFAPAPIHEAIVSLFASLLIGGWLKEKYFPQVQQTFTECRTEVIAALSPRFGPLVAARLTVAVIEGDRPRILDMIRPLRRALLLRSLRRHPLRSIAAIFRHYASEICFRHAPQSRERVSILAQNGYGQASLSESLLPRLQSVAVAVESEADVPIARRDVSGLILWMAGDWLRLLRKRKILTLTLREGGCPVNRAFADFPPAWMARLIGSLTPSPDLCILLQAGREENLAVTPSRQEACLAFLKTRKRSVVLDASLPIEKLTERAYAAILDVLVQRAENRLKKRFP
jgi:hypothetical protein